MAHDWRCSIGSVVREAVAQGALDAVTDAEVIQEIAYRFDRLPNVTRVDPAELTW